MYTSNRTKPTTDSAITAISSMINDVNSIEGTARHIVQRATTQCHNDRAKYSWHEARRKAVIWPIHSAIAGLPTPVASTKLPLAAGRNFRTQWDDIDLAAETVTVNKTMTEDIQGRQVRSEPKTKKSRRVLWLPSLAAEPSSNSSATARQRHVSSSLRAEGHFEKATSPGASSSRCSSGLICQQ